MMSQFFLADELSNCGSGFLNMSQKGSERAGETMCSYISTMLTAGCRMDSATSTKVSFDVNP